MKQAIIFHGTHGSPSGNWFPWLKNYLEENGWQAHTPALPTPTNQSLDNWKKSLAEQVPNYAHTDLVIGHSCGGSFALKLLQHDLIKPKQTILAGCVIDTLGNEFDALNKSFIEDPFNWQKIGEACKNIVVFHGDNDPYVPTTQAQIISTELNAPLHMIANGGHLNAETGYLEFPELLDIINAT